jgi:hypothetical protein
LPQTTTRLPSTLVDIPSPQQSAFLCPLVITEFALESAVAIRPLTALAETTTT